MIPGLREDSLYYNAYLRLRRPLVEMMLDGVAWDSQSAEKEKANLSEKEIEIKARLDRATSGVRLYRVTSGRSAAYNDLLAQQKSIRAALKNAGGAKTETGKVLNAELKALQARNRDLRAAGGHRELKFGDAISGKQLAEYLYDRLGLPAFRRRRKATGKSTITVDDTALQKLAQRYGQRVLESGVSLAELITLVREHRRCEKLISTYLNPEKLLNPLDGRFHSHYKPHGTQSGRLSSSSDPWGFGGNSQNVDRDLKWLFLPN